ncbi:trifunctional serine/threonine-protein kinase/ATP-binding protein/sensor histidine kinase [Methylobacter tundripaludum]|uniref:histidine kinase n=1 Tax=Methylobacter tundripaludum (strain ATCC BAA-1195 / DSM 17260 / SV96) TaxID=697282 RepID=G3ITY8_METTV|nr:AAA family ATPase [Methylobacter tundripaludum]EGW21471.1 multi-sensor signal transduction multi-kinase [Methylobacter tundripaludum SV96]
MIDITTKNKPQGVPKLGNYIVTEKLGESLQALVFKGYHKDVPDQPLIIKRLKLLSSWDDQSRHLRQKIERLKVLHDPRVCTPIALESYGDQQFIVQPWFAGQPLNCWVKQQDKLDLNDFFTLACTLADTLQAVHDAGITHGGIKPHNILLQPGTLTLRLTDFITPLDIRDVSHFIYDPEFVRHTLAYTSPEQTGRINYRVDFSTDLYSLGIVFYELLTGQLPFFSSDPLELIHSHLAEETPKVNQLNPQLPQALADIIAKLTVKQPEKRYQSASGLLADLIRCKNEYSATGNVSAFTVGQHDRSRRVIFISKMVGRQTESLLIQQQYNEVIDGKFRSVFISGLSGIGKTRLIQELQKPLVKNRGYFTSGKFDQYQKNIPYSSLIQALRNLIRIFLTESDSQVQQWRAKILDVVDSNGSVISDVLPELEFIIGPQPEVPHLPPVEARNRFNNLFGRFLACLASEDNPLVLFIDDLQWCDSATFDFLQNLFDSHHEHPFLFFMGAYRHNEVDSSHPLSKLIRKIQENNGPFAEIRVEALTDADCHEMVAYILDSSLEATANLAEFIAHLTEGNPLFVSESLAWLYNEDLLNTDAEQHWHWDIKRIRDTQMPTSVVELFSSKVGKLPVKTLHILDHCACMGNRFSVEDVALVLDIRIEQLFEDLKPVLNLGMLLENKSDLQFVHDRVQEAVLRQVDSQAKPAIHWRIGNRLLQAVPTGTDLESLDNLFTIAAHLNLGRPADLDQELAYRLVNINFHAGNKALDALAGDAANDFFQKAHDYLPDDCWQQAYDLTFRIYQRLAKTELMCGRYEKSEVLLNHLIEYAASDLDKAEALAEQTTSLSSFGNFNKAIATANRGLAYFGKAIPEQPETAQQRMLALMAQIEQQDDVWTTILHMPFTKDRKSKIELAFYSELIPDLYMSGLVPQLYLSAAQSTLHCLQGGMDESVIYSFSIMGLNLGEQGKFEPAFLYQDLAHDLCAKHPNTFGATRGMNGIVWCNMHSRSHPAEIVDYCHKGIQCGKNCGDLYNAGLSYGPLMWNLQVQGKNLRWVEEAAEECLNFSRKNQLLFSVGLAEAVLAGWVAPMKADYQPVDMTETLARWEADNYVSASGSYFALLGFAQHYLGDYAAAAVSLQTVERYLHGLTDNVLKRLWYVFRIVNRLRWPEGADWPTLEAEIAPLLAELETWARLGPLLQPFLAFIHAEIARARNQMRDARNLYLDAIAIAQAQNYDLLTGHLYEALAEVLTAGNLGDAELYYGAARRMYGMCRADRKSELLQQRHPYTAPDNAVRAEKTVALDAPATLPNLDFNYLIKSALALSAEVDLNRLMQKIMTVVLESSGAQHGYLLIKEADELLIAAEYHVGKKHVVNRRHLNLNQTSGSISRAIVNYVLRTRKKVLLHDAMTEGEFQNTPEVQALRLRSVLCLPVIKQKELIGLLYLENRLSTGVFTAEKTDMTELLTAQAAISLENARLLEQTLLAYTKLQENQEHMLQMEKLSALGTLVGGVAHEINNPLMGIMNFVEFAADRSTDEKSKEVLDQALQQIHRIKKIVSNMLLFIHTRSVPSGNCQVAEVIKQTQLLLEGELSKNGIAVEVDAANDLPAIRCSADSLQQILVNLIINARDALADSRQPQIKIIVRPMEEMLELSVTDNGPGIPQDIQSKIFDPFFTTKPPGKGTGLGLSVIRRLVQDVGGNIQVESIYGHGCCMRLRFPPI